MVESGRSAVWHLLALFVANLGVSVSTAELAKAKPLKVFVLAGQSNMQGHAQVKTIDAMSLDPDTAAVLFEMQDANGQPVVCDEIWISSIGSASEEKKGRLTVGYGAESRGPKIGPEFTFGIYASKLLGEPILIIKTAWGGKSLHTDFRPPSAGPYRFNSTQISNFGKQGKSVAAIKEEKAAATGKYYRMMIDHVKSVLDNAGKYHPNYNADDGYELAGFVWFQGWNDMVDSGTYPDRGSPGGYDDYSKVLAHFIRDVRKDLSAPKLPFVIGVLGVGGQVEQFAASQQRYKPVHANFRQAMAAPAKLAEFAGNVAVVQTEDYWDQKVTQLRESERTIRPQRERIQKRRQSGEISKADEAKAVDELYSKTFTKDELTLLRESTSNFDFHYMGSARVIAPIGKAFAEAVVELNEK